MTALEHLLGWQESSTTAEAIAAALEAVRDGAAAGTARGILARAERVVVTGAGSSYYLAQAVAAVARETTGRPFVAAPLSELLLRPSGVLLAVPPAAQPVIVISRSGSTSEAVRVVDQVSGRGHPTIAVTCRATSPMAARADVSLVSPAGDERAIVMTRSFASMLALLLRLVADVAGDAGLAADLDALPAHWAEASAGATVGQRLGTTDWSRIVILAGGAALPVAIEWGLKLTEITQVPILTGEPLEFRHGPISVCEPGMLVVALLGGPGTADELRVVAETAALGASTWVIAQDEPVGEATGETSLIGRGLRPSARLPLLVHAGHALAFSLAATRGLDADQPRHLAQVVILDPA
jgi:glucosamine--fructose-6-phosphate aminotransferase (isomerizing)